MHGDTIRFAGIALLVLTYGTIGFFALRYLGWKGTLAVTSISIAIGTVMTLLFTMVSSPEIVANLFR